MKGKEYLNFKVHLLKLKQMMNCLQSKLKKQMKKYFKKKTTLMRQLVRQLVIPLMFKIILLLSKMNYLKKISTQKKKQDLKKHTFLTQRFLIKSKWKIDLFPMISKQNQNQNKLIILFKLRMFILNLLLKIQI